MTQDEMAAIMIVSMRLWLTNRWLPSRSLPISREMHSDRPKLAIIWNRAVHVSTTAYSPKTSCPKNRLIRMTALACDTSDISRSPARKIPWAAKVFFMTLPTKSCTSINLRRRALRISSTEDRSERRDYTMDKNEIMFAEAKNAEPQYRIVAQRSRTHRKASSPHGKHDFIPCRRCEARLG